MSIFLISTLRSKPGMGHAILKTFTRMSVLHARAEFGGDEHYYRRGQKSIRILERFDMVSQEDDDEEGEGEEMGGMGEGRSEAGSEREEEGDDGDDDDDDLQKGGLNPAEEGKNDPHDPEKKEDDTVPIYKPIGKKVMHLVIITEWESDDSIQNQWESSSFNLFTETIRPYISSRGTSLGSYTELFSRMEATTTTMGGRRKEQVVRVGAGLKGEGDGLRVDDSD